LGGRIITSEVVVALDNIGKGRELQKAVHRNPGETADDDEKLPQLRL
jgi:hypothetical protein